MKRSACLNLVLTCLAGANFVAQPAGAQAPPKGPGSISGVWFGDKFSPIREGPPDALPRERLTDNGKPPQVRPWAAKIVEQRIQAFKDGHPYAKLTSVCIPDGVPAMMLPAPERPIQIIETPSQVTILFENLDSFRIVRLNQKHSKNPAPTLMGESVGHWEGETLVVDTIGLSDKASVDGLIPHTDALHVIERFRRAGEGGLDYRVTIDDPKTFVQPYTVVFPYKRVAGETIQEAVCENQRNGLDVNGNTGVQLSSGVR